MMLVEGYKLHDCQCGMKNSLEFHEIPNDNKILFVLVCMYCGKGTEVSNSKENAVHHWNKNNSLLLG